MNDKPAMANTQAFAVITQDELSSLRAELAELRARVKEVPRTTEWHIAMREANQIHDADAYFAARSEMLDSGHNRHLFEAGYQRGFDAGEKVYAGTAAAAVPEDVAKDAERYRFLKERSPFGNRVPHIEQYPYQPKIDRSEFPHFTVVGIDEAIDAAILAAKEKGQ